jgi:hypothetical protein
MDTMIAYCGLDCFQCEAFKATQAHDEAAKAEIAKKWQQAFNAPDITPAFVTCDGCLNEQGHLGGHCLECEIRACGVAKQVVNCGHCKDMKSCNKLSEILNMSPEAKANLEKEQMQP